jgi:iron uptake system EfeUOB component EfeO/EfeM
VQRGKSFTSGVLAGGALFLALWSAPALAESDSGSGRSPGKAIDPLFEAKLDEGAAAYKQLAAADIARLVVACDRMLAALESHDLPSARQAWINARIGYERSEIFTIKFPYLDGAIDSWPNAKVGFHAIEAKLFAPGAPLPLAEARALVEKVHTLQQVFRGEPLYAHGVLVGIGSLAYELGESKAKGGESGISGTSLADMQHNLEGIELAWSTVFSAPMQTKNKGVGDRVEKEIAELHQLLNVASLSQLDASVLETKAEMLAGSVSDAGVALGWPAPDFTDSE